MSDVEAMLDEAEGIPENGAAPAPSVNFVELEEIWAPLLNALAPEGEVEFEDITGYVHRARCRAPARIELKLTRLLSRLLKLPAGPQFVSAIRSVTGGEVADGESNIIDAIAEILDEDSGVADIVAEAFGIAHPGPLARAIANAKANPDSLAYVGEGSRVDALDLFDTAALVTALLPFGGRVARKAIRVLSAAGGVQSTSRSLN